MIWDNNAKRFMNCKLNHKCRKCRGRKFRVSYVQHKLFVIDKRVFLETERPVCFLKTTNMFQFHRWVPRGGAGVVILCGANFVVEAAANVTRHDLFFPWLKFVLALVLVLILVLVLVLFLVFVFWIVFP